ncbi:MAG: excinuclease ABC subunit A, partial [Flavobacteriales bacterium]
QRVTLAGTLGNNLSGSIYILDEPSVGLHPVDTERLMNILRFLRQLGNTVVVVEHEEEIIRSADTVIDLGPGAGTGGGKVMYQGDLKGLMKSTNSLTAQYLREEKCIKLPPARRMWKKSISIKGASENNLRKIDVDIPLGVMTVVCGVSGSGKSSLVIDVLSKGLYNALGISTIKPGSFSEITGDIEAISGVEVVDQSPIGKSSRSNPVTYLKAFDEIRELYSRQRESKIHGYKPSFFSFNVDGGRCDACQGEGETIVEMQFMADVRLKCDVCKGQRYKDEILDVKYRGKNIYDLLQMTVDEAMDFFKSDGAEKKSLQKRICQKLQPLLEVGLGYLPMGQASSTLSGGEAQRIKLASFLSANVPAGANKMMFIFDEPTTGLHFHDIGKLMDSFNALIGRGHSVIIIEHNVEVIKCADWVLELGPGGGRNGGELLYAGRPEDLLHCPDSRTAEFLHSKLPVD